MRLDRRKGLNHFLNIQFHILSSFLHRLCYCSYSLTQACHVFSDLIKIFLIKYQKKSFQPNIAFQIHCTTHLPTDVQHDTKFRLPDLPYEGYEDLKGQYIWLKRFKFHFRIDVWVEAVGQPAI